MNQIEGDQSEQFSLLPVLCHYIRNQDEYNMAEIEWHLDYSFHRLFIAPGALRRSFAMNIRHFIAINTIYTISRKFSFLKLI